MTFRVFLAVAIAAFVQSSLFAENNSGGSEDQPCILVAAADVDVFSVPTVQPPFSEPFRRGRGSPWLSEQREDGWASTLEPPRRETPGAFAIAG